MAKIQKSKPNSVKNAEISPQIHVKMEIDDLVEDADQSGPSSLFELAQSIVYNAVQKVSFKVVNFPIPKPCFAFLTATLVI